MIPKTRYQEYEILFQASPSQTVWCELHGQPIRRDLPIELEDGKVVRARAGFCYKCKLNFINGGTCDPI